MTGLSGAYQMPSKKRPEPKENGTQRGQSELNCGFCSDSVFLGCRDQLCVVEILRHISV